MWNFKGAYSPYFVTLLAIVCLSTSAYGERRVVSPIQLGACRGVARNAMSAGPRAAEPLSASEECALRPKDRFKECASCPEMVVVPAGSFLMGSAPNEVGRTDDEGPQHRVTLAASFAVGRFEVTVEQFAAFVNESAYDGGHCFTFEDGRWTEKIEWSWRNPGFPQTGSHPATCINWNDAGAYLAWLSKKTGKEYRLLSEAEWEFAVRSATTTRYYFGNHERDICKYANGADQSAKTNIPGARDWIVARCRDGYAYTAPVGRFPANAFALHDMSGNVWEWTQECYHGSYTGAPMDGSAWTSGDCGLRVARGGSWFNKPRDLRSALRYWIDPDYRLNNVGLRVGRTLTR